MADPASVSTAAELKAALARGDSPITLDLPSGVTTLKYNEGIVIDGSPWCFRIEYR
ncbi:MAG: hypothetical protein FWG03_03065 [Clostridiales bacterium]|nr:hypothetical protein [Clostridiales bacterium]